jgi:hypothetical protein
MTFFSALRLSNNGEFLCIAGWFRYPKVMGHESKMAV